MFHARNLIKRSCAFDPRTHARGRRTTVATDVLELPPSSRNSLFDRAVNSFSTTPDCRTVILSYSHILEFLREVIHIFFLPPHLFFSFFFPFFFWHIATEAGYPRRPSKVGGFVQLSVRAFRPSAHTASHISVWRGGQKGERGSAATSREREKTLLSADCCGALGVPPPSFLRDPSPPSPSIRVFRNWQLIGN